MNNLNKKKEQKVFANVQKRKYLLMKSGKSYPKREWQCVKNAEQESVKRNADAISRIGIYLYLKIFSWLILVLVVQKEEVGTTQGVERFKSLFHMWIII